MSDIQIYLLEAEKNKPEAQRIAQQSAAKLETKQLKLIDLITSLEEYINNKDDGNLRAKSVAYLADVLEHIPSKVLTGQERRLLCDFVLGRLEGDVEGVGASARALLALEERGKWDAETAQKVMRTVLDHTHPLRQFKLQTERFPVIQLIDLLLAKYRKAMLQIHEGDPEFMASFISFFEGEKDPRNLMIVFSLLQVPMAEWDISSNAQDMFEAVFNYFPITFKPPPDDPYGITAQDLKDRLRDCISANSDFAPYAIPALLDKLDSTSVNTKRDVLQTLQSCIARYGAQTINLYSVTLWDALKFEVLNVQEEDLAAEALKALTSIAAKFANSTDGPLLAYLRPVIKECCEHLEDAPTKQSQAAGRILYSIANAGPQVADKLARGILPTFFTLYQASNSIGKRRGLLEVFNQVSKAYVGFQKSEIDLIPEALQAFANDAVDNMLRALLHAPKAEVSFRLTALQGLVQLISISKVLTDAQISNAIDAVIQIILHEHIEGHGDIRTDAIQALNDIAHSTPDAVRAQVIPAFMVELPDMPDSEAKYKPVLEAFAQLSSEPQIFDTVVLRLKNKLNAAKIGNAPQEYQNTLLLALLYAFTCGSPISEDGIVRSSYFSEYAEPLLLQFRDALPSERDSIFTEIIGRIINIILRPQTPHFQSTVYNKNLKWIAGLSSSDPSVNARSRAFAPLLLHYYAALRPEIPEPSDVSNMLRVQVENVLSPGNDSEKPATLRLMSLLVNKFLEPKSMEKSLEQANIHIASLVGSRDNMQGEMVAFTVTRALIVQGKCGSLTLQYLQLLLDNLPKADKVYAQQFETLLAPDDILTKENHCNVSGLYKQRTFNQTVPNIAASVRAAVAEVKPNYLIALSGILKWLPFSLIEPSLASLISPLLQSLDLNDPASQEVKSSSLTIFESLLMHDPSIASEHSASLITRLLHATSAPGNIAKVRAKALQCLTLVPRQLKREAVVPYRRPVVKKLQACLDDAKRNVRAEAVRCRSAWLALDEGTEEEE